MTVISQEAWYELVEGGALEQGDLLFQCPVSVLVSEEFPLTPEQPVQVDILMLDMVVMTQSCELENSKTPDVVLCAHWDIEEAKRQGLPLGRKDSLTEIQKGRRPRYTLLNRSAMPQKPLDLRIVDCGKVFCLPFSYVQKIAISQGPRLRLRSPYREHLSQAYARFFMRVGLPQDITLP